MEQFDNDIELVKRLKKGDLESFRLIYEKYSKKLFVFSFKYLKSVSDSEELVQQVFLILWENRKKLDEYLSFKSYLFKIAYNNIITIFRKRKYFQNFLAVSELRNSEYSFETEERIDLNSVLDNVAQIIEKLPEKQKVIFKECRYKGKSAKEIAAKYGLSSGTVDNYISMASTFIRKHLAKDDLYFSLIISFFF